MSLSVKVLDGAACLAIFGMQAHQGVLLPACLVLAGRHQLGESAEASI